MATTLRRKQSAMWLQCLPSEATSVSTVTTTLGGGVIEEKVLYKKPVSQKICNRNKKGDKNRKTGGVGGNVVAGGNAAPRTTRLVNVNDAGAVIGQDHPRAVLADAEVLLVLELRGERYSYDWLAAKFEVSKSCIQKICNGTRRAQIAVGTKRIRRGTTSA